MFSIRAWFVFPSYLLLWGINTVNHLDWHLSNHTLAAKWLILSGREWRYRYNLVWRLTKPLNPQFMGDLFTICTGHWLLNSPRRSILGHSEEERSRAITSSNSNLRLANRHQVHIQTLTHSDTSYTFAQDFAGSCKAFVMNVSGLQCRTGIFADLSFFLSLSQKQCEKTKSWYEDATFSLKATKSA